MDEIILYQSEDGRIRIETRLKNETVWLTQAQMSELFQKERSVITKHINNVFAEGELDEKSNVQILHISGSDRPVKFYNLDVIISVGYRVKSHQGTRFRQWATARLDDFLKMTGNDILTHAGKISHQKALEKARAEYEKYHQQQLHQPTQAEKDYIHQIEQAAKKLKKKNGK